MAIYYGENVFEDFQIHPNLKPCLDTRRIIITLWNRDTSYIYFILLLLALFGELRIITYLSRKKLLQTRDLYSVYSNS